MSTLVPVRARSAVSLTLVFAVGIVAFGWPFLIEPGAALDTSHSGDAPVVFVVLLPLLAAVVLSELTSGVLDAKAVALLGMLAAVGGALRALGPGTAVLAAQPPLVLLDEPTRGLDYTAKHRLVEILRDLAANGHAVLLATHDVELVAEVATRVLVIADGELVADGPTADVVVSSPAFAPQVAKVLAPQRWLTPTEVAVALASGSRIPR